MKCTSHIYLPNGNPEGNEPNLGTGAYYDIEGKLHDLQDQLKHAFILGIMDCCRDELPTKGGNKPYSAPKKGSLCMIYATRPGDSALVSAKMTYKLVAHMENCLKENGMILFPDDISYFDHPDQTCEVCPRITFKMVLAEEGFVYKDEKTLLQENKMLREELELERVRQNTIMFNLFQTKNKTLEETINFKPTSAVTPVTAPSEELKKLQSIIKEKDKKIEQLESKIAE